MFVFFNCRNSLGWSWVHLALLLSVVMVHRGETKRGLERHLLHGELPLRH